MREERSAPCGRVFSVSRSALTPLRSFLFSILEVVKVVPRAAVRRGAEVVVPAVAETVAVVLFFEFGFFAEGVRRIERRVDCHHPAARDERNDAACGFEVWCALHRTTSFLPWWI